MKKALVILLALTMVMSMMAIAPIGVSAADEVAIGSVAADYKPEGTAIKTAEEFAAMDPAGTYYLANDITISKTYEANFTGTFDGNGKTITTTVPTFMEVNGTIKNLTVAGSISTEEAIGYDSNAVDTGANVLNYIAGVACAAATSATTNFINVCNKVSLASNLCAKGGIAGVACPTAMADSGITVNFTDCANYGTIIGKHDSRTDCDNGGILAFLGGSANANFTYAYFTNCYNYATINAGGRPGGIGGYLRTSVTVTNCHNYGDILSTSNYCGGIIGRCGTNGGHNNYVFTDSSNSGDVSVFSGQGAGFVGYSGACDSYTFKNCVNNGAVYAEKSQATTKNIDLAGFLGNMRQTGSDYVDTIYFENCVNNGTIGTKGLVGGQEGNARYCSGFVNKPRVEKSFTMINCINNGEIYADGVTQGGSNAAGLVALVLFKNKTNDGAKFVNCVNNGNVVSTGKAGGVVSEVGAADQYGNAEFIGCGNNGNVLSETNNAGGVICYVYGTQYEGADFLYCFNTGAIESKTSYAGGILAYTNDYAVTTNVQYCYSAGKITSGRTVTGDFGTGVVDGAVSDIKIYTYTNSLGNTKYFITPAAGKVTIANDVVTFTANTAYNYTNENVVNGETLAAGKRYGYTDANGDKWVFMTSSAVSGVVSIADNAGAAPTIVCGGYTLHCMPWNVVDNTTVELMQFDENPGATALMWNNKGQQDFSNNNYVLEGIAPSAYVIGSGASWGAMQSDTGVNYVQADAFASGEIAYLINEAVGETVFYQNLIETLFTVDAYPTTDATHAKVVLQGGTYSNQLFEQNPDVTPPTGDATIYVVIALAVSTVSLAALAVVKKRKEN